MLNPRVMSCWIRLQNTTHKSIQLKTINNTLEKVSKSSKSWLSRIPVGGEFLFCLTNNKCLGGRYILLLFITWFISYFSRSVGTWYCKYLELRSYLGDVYRFITQQCRSIIVNLFFIRNNNFYKKILVVKQ